MSYSAGEKLCAVIFVSIILLCIYLFISRVNTVRKHKDDRKQFEIDCNKSGSHSVYECKALTKQAF